MNPNQSVEPSSTFSYSIPISNISHSELTFSTDHTNSDHSFTTDFDESQLLLPMHILDNNTITNTIHSFTELKNVLNSWMLAVKRLQSSTGMMFFCNCHLELH